MVDGLNNVVQAARSQAVKEASTTDSQSSLVPLPIFSLKEEPEKSSYDVADPEEEFLSPEERIEKRMKEKELKAEKFKKTSNQVTFLMCSKTQVLFVERNIH